MMQFSVFKTQIPEETLKTSGQNIDFYSMVGILLKALLVEKQSTSPHVPKHLGSSWPAKKKRPRRRYVPAKVVGRCFSSALP